MMLFQRSGETTASTRSVTAIPQLLSMLEMATTNDELLVKIKDWTQLMNK